MSDALPQLVADRYRLLAPLGQGGMGRVWRARDEVLHRDVAIKELVPPPGLTDDERREMRERSLREARAIARLNNINVVRIFDVLRTDGDPWIVMEYVESKSLQDTLADDGPVPAARAVEIGLGVLGALKAAHKAGVMHRDVKPGNVLLGTDGRVVLTDFGLATIPGDPNVTRTGMVLGSPAYIAPERARDGTAGPEADLWSLGATLYAAVEGKSPYARSSAIATLAALATEPLPPARNAGPLKPVLNGLLRKDPQERITAEVAERMLRRAGGKRTRTIPLLDGVRRPGPNGPREPRPPLVPAPRPAGETSAATATPPAPRAPQASVGTAAASAADETRAEATVTDAAPAGVSAPATDTDATKAMAGPAPTSAESTSAGAEPTTKPEPAAQAEPATQSGPAGQAEPATTVEPAAKGDTGGAKGGPATDSEPTAKGEPAAKAGSAAQPAAVKSALSKPAATSVLPPAAPVSPAPERGRVFASGTSSRGRRHRRLILIGALVGVLLLGLAVVVPLLSGGDEDDAGDTPQGAPTAPTAAPTSAAAPQTSQPAAPPPTSAAPSPTPSSTPPETPSAPADGLLPGWELRRDPVGFSVPVPPNWRRSAGDTWVKYEEPDGVRELVIDRTDKPQRDAAAAWRAIESGRSSIVNDYELIGIRSVDCAWRTCADWDWRETRDGTRIRVRNRGFVTASNRGFAIRWEVADKDWKANLDEFEMIFREFVPDRRD
ncbi:Serine/threonine protein kinase [Micromonospora nigra]|uniref:non-specific serine/threonine protein kinase n=1 Tax=Micromonospora nigra TaxID=145857 RepID=A0A1C6SDV7_9ACTN|nr:serine/threonine-protein kinase [Micromonospora nigra]SCL27509.1 Serine/threonine protein kinase [Micromonospora nigra]